MLKAVNSTPKAMSSINGDAARKSKNLTLELFKQKQGIVQVSYARKQHPKQIFKKLLLKFANSISRRHYLSIMTVRENRDKHPYSLKKHGNL